MESSGHSGSKLHLHKGWVWKRSSYLSRCSEKDYRLRAAFLLSLNAQFPHMPRINFLDNREMAIEFISGWEGIEGLDFSQFGQVVRKLHSLEIMGPPKDTGIDWLLTLAAENLTRVGGKLDETTLELFDAFTEETVVHGEITQVITRPDGSLYILDWDECGMGSRYQDLGFVHYQFLERGLELESFQDFMDGYADESVNDALVQAAAGLIALAYARFYDFERRIALGRGLLHL
jgi:hypothetical protein